MEVKMRSGLVFLLMLSFTACAASDKPKPRLGILPDFDGPLCTEDEKKSLGLDECTRRLLAFVGRGVQSVVVLRTSSVAGLEKQENFVGAGIVLDDQGHVLTAYSAVVDIPEINVIVRAVGGADGRLLYDEGIVVPMHVRSYAERLNIALLEPAEPQRFPRPFMVDASVQWLDEGEKLWLFASPTLFTSGTVIVRDGEYSSFDLVRVGFPVKDADLGGGVISSDGRVVGIVVGSGHDGESSFVVPVSTAVQLFDIQPASATASQDIGTVLDSYLAPDWTEVGMCDRMRTLIYRIETPPDVTVSGIIPLTDDQFVDVKTVSDGKDIHRYFIMRRAQDGEAAVVVELQGMEWGLTLRSQSLNAYYFHYRLGQANDCSMQAVTDE